MIFYFSCAQHDAGGRTNTVRAKKWAKKFTAKRPRSDAGRATDIKPRKTRTTRNGMARGWQRHWLLPHCTLAARGCPPWNGGGRKRLASPGCGHRAEPRPGSTLHGAKGTTTWKWRRAAGGTGEDMADLPRVTKRGKLWQVPSSPGLDGLVRTGPDNRRDGRV